MAIAFVGAPTAGTGTGTATTTGSRTWTAGNVVVVASSVSNGNIAVNSITSSGGAITWFALPAAIRNTSPGNETWFGVITTGFTGTITQNLSGSTNSVINAAEFSGTVACGIGNSSAPVSTADPSISLTTSGGNTWVVGTFTANDTAAFTAGTGTLSTSATLTNVGGALVYNASNAAIGGTGTASVTHASASWGIGLIELYDGGIDYGNGAYSLGGPGTNGYSGGYNNFQTGVSLTTGANAGGYTLNSASLITNHAGNSGDLRCALYDNDASPGKDLIVQGGPLAFGIPAGTGTPNIHTIALASALAANTTYWITWNNNNSSIAMRIDDTSFSAGTLDIFATATFGAAPDPLGAESQENGGPHMWVHVSPVAAGGFIRRGCAMRNLLVR